MRRRMLAKNKRSINGGTTSLLRSDKGRDENCFDVVNLTDSANEKPFQDKKLPAECAETDSSSDAISSIGHSESKVATSSPLAPSSSTTARATTNKTAPVGNKNATFEQQPHAALKPKRPVQASQSRSPFKALTRRSPACQLSNAASTPKQSSAMKNVMRANLSPSVFVETKKNKSHEL